MVGFILIGEAHSDLRVQSLAKISTRASAAAYDAGFFKFRRYCCMAWDDVRN